MGYRPPMSFNTIEPAIRRASTHEYLHQSLFGLNLDSVNFVTFFSLLVPLYCDLCCPEFRKLFQNSSDYSRPLSEVFPVSSYIYAIQHHDVQLLLNIVGFFMQKLRANIVWRCSNLLLVRDHRGWPKKEWHIISFSF